MAETFKILGQSAPAATTETVLYTVPALTAAVISTICICNRGAAASFRLSVSAAGAATEDKDYLYYDFPLAANDSIPVVRGLTLGAGAVIRVYTSTNTVSFSIFGVERT